MENLLQITNLNKSYNGIPALRNINLSVKAGEIHGIVGANGSGKTTLMNILFGSPIISETGGYEGEIYFAGQRISLRNCTEAITCGIGMVHQEFALIPDMTVRENIKLGREKTMTVTDWLFGRQFSFIDTKHDNESSMQTLRKLGIDLNADIRIIDLSINLKQFVEIAREIDRTDLKLLILDEPTAVLNQDDGLKLLEILRKMSERGIGILFISHRLEEVQALCDRVSVFRDGELVSRYEKGCISINDLARDMIGHIVNKAVAEKRTIESKPIITFKQFSVAMPGEEVKALDLSVYRGEIIGLTSLSGHGKLALGYGMMGMYPVNGEVYFDNKRIAVMDAKANIVKGMYVLPDDRQGLGILADQSVENNIIFTGNQIKNMFSRKAVFSYLGLIDHRKTSDYVNKIIKDFDIKCTSIKQKVKELSGGNQQKVCIARALTVEPRLLFVAEPTRGVDISAKEKILNMLLEINRTNNTTIVIASSELDELKRVCDRIAVMVQGKVFKILSPDSSEVDFGLALSGEEGVDHAQL
ncbi:MAG TPA: sugar ABC transporter ATP-binding protein [Syntrophomonadaceae bacterium]|nr:sugar ABC transporter ATP-binding protein [Syntrophomonadaceae bacterium]HPR94212.1 sugar ABC transporter ATP-binding protein [Syntrophomonadaceae bacterium]